MINYKRRFLIAQSFASIDRAETVPVVLGRLRCGLMPRDEDLSALSHSWDLGVTWGNSPTPIYGQAWTDLRDR